MSGVLVLVAGPSGAGKDTLLRLAAEQLAGDERFVFVRRVITRPADAGAEDHDTATSEEFGRRASDGAFALNWQAHGLSYGVPRAIEDDMAAGRVVIVNVSRGVIAEAARRYPNARAVIVSAPIEMLAARLAARGREPASELEARLKRHDLLKSRMTTASDAAASEPTIRPIEIRNDRSPQEGAEALIAVLRACLAPPSTVPHPVCDTHSLKVETTS